MSRIGLFGGSFNPVHVGHLILAERVRCDRSLDRVLFIPALEPPHKPGEPLAPAAERLRMVGMAVEGNPAFEPSALEIERGGPSYTLLTVRDVRAEVGPDADLFLIVGADSLCELHTWWRAHELVQEARVIAVPRPGRDVGSGLAECAGRFGQDWADDVRSLLVEMPQIEISSTDVRRRVREGRSIRYLVPEAVRHHILANGLYCDGDQR